LARAAGVSLPTVSFALINHPRVSAKTRERIAATAARLGYVPNHAARRLARSRANSKLTTSFDQVGFMYITAGPFAPDPVSVAMMHGAEQELSSSASPACLMFVPVEQRSWQKAERLVRSGIVDGWILAGVVDNEAIDRLNDLRVPHVVVGDHTCTRPVHAVKIDNFGVGRLAAHHLADLGHRRIGFGGGTQEFAYQREHLAGFRAGLRERGIELDDRLLFLIGRGGPKLWDIRTIDDPPTAIFLIEPQSGERLEKILGDMGLNVPQDLSVITCEISGSPAIVPNLTRIELPMQEVGRKGSALLRKFAAEPGVASSELKIAPIFVDCGSTHRITHSNSPIP
jgi:DNA-binding LacI/PurR family transcriptional regulator